jgi:hypothetical protein
MTEPDTQVQTRQEEPMRSRIAIAVLAAAAGNAAAQPTLFFADIFNPTAQDGTVQRWTGSLTPIATPGGGLRAVAIDPAAAKIYWTDVDNFAIRRANLDGTHPEDVITSGLVFPSTLAIDVTNRKLYWGDQVTEEIWRTNLDNPFPELVTTTPINRGLAIDEVHGKIYWTTSRTASTGDVRRADLSGFNQETLINGSVVNFKPDILALDVPRNRMYFSDSVTDTLRRASLDGAGITPLYTNQFGMGPRGVAVDPATGDLYWGRDVGDEPPTGEIQKAVGGEPVFELVVDGVGLVNSIAVGPSGPAPCYPNCDASTQPPVLNVNDFVCFQSAFAASQPYADCNHDNALNVNDFVCFQSSFAAGCP